MSSAQDMDYTPPLSGLDAPAGQLQQHQLQEQRQTQQQQQQQQQHYQRQLLMQQQQQQLQQQQQQQQQIHRQQQQHSNELQNHIHLLQQLTGVAAAHPTGMLMPMSGQPVIVARTGGVMSNTLSYMSTFAPTPTPTLAMPRPIAPVPDVKYQQAEMLQQMPQQQPMAFVSSPPAVRTDSFALSPSPTPVSAVSAVSATGQVLSPDAIFSVHLNGYGSSTGASDGPVAFSSSADTAHAVSDVKEAGAALSSVDSSVETRTRAMLRDANMLRSRNKIEDAIAAYDEILALDPGCVEVLNSKGVCFKQLGNDSAAMSCYNAAAQLKPGDWRAHNNRGVIFKETGMFKEAINAYKLAIQCFEREHGAAGASSTGARCIANENMAIVLTDLGTRLKVAANSAAAVSRYNEAVRFSPTYAPAYFNLGVVFSETGRYADALRCYEMALERNPQYVEALCNIGVIYKNSNQLEQAVSFYERALAINPNFRIAASNLAIAYTDLGTKLKNDGKSKEAIRMYKKSLVHNPKYADAWYNLGVAHAENGGESVDDAIVCYETAVAFNAKCAQAYNNLGVIYKDRGNLERAISYYDRALTINPKFAQTLNNMGVIYTLLGRLEEAYVYCKRAIAANPQYGEAYNNLGVLYRDEGLIQEAIAAYNQCLKLSPDSRSAGQNRLLAMNSIMLAERVANGSTEVADTPAAASTVSSSSAVLLEVYNAHVEWGRRFARSYTQFTSWPNQPSSSRALRVGYVSGDFFTHSVSYFIEAPLKFANRSSVFVVCYSNVTREDAKTARLKAMAPLWRTITGQDSAAVARLVRSDAIDILVDLTGHTAGNRLDVFAHKPAPIQISWIGYPNTTGLPTMDYRLTDSIVDPISSPQQFAEELVRLPGPFLCYTPVQTPPPVGPLPALNNHFITFGSFNNLAKVNSQVLQLWAAVLQQVPQSRLLMKCKPFACAGTRKKVFKRLEQYGIPAKRVDLIPLLPSTADHLMVYNMVDISIDTFPYAGTTTTCEALLMGVPVVTLKGAPPLTCHAHNVGVSIISRLVEMAPALIASSPTEYVAKAVALANDVPRLQAMRMKLRSALLSSAVCDGKTFTSNLEHTLRGLWQRWCSTRIP